LQYIDGLAPFQSSIDTVFGTAFHETLQYYLTVLYTESVKKADSLNLPEILKNKLREEYLRCVVENNNEHFSNPLQLAEYHSDGVAILDWFKKKRAAYFSTKNYELVAIEMELCVPASDKIDSVYWYGFIDVVIRHTETNTIIIYDIKTSRSGWNATAKGDSIKMAQLIAYKNYFSKQFGMPIDNIELSSSLLKER
jgi:ATP-dependent exoDNAse (exonuclease V) beta subunit